MPGKLNAPDLGGVANAAAGINAEQNEVGEH